MFDVYFAIYGVIVLGLAVLVFMALSGGGVKRKENRMFAAFTMLVAIWIVANHISNDITQPPSTSTVANYFIFSSSFGAMILIMKLMSHMVGDIKSSGIIRKVEPVLWAACIIAATPLTAKGVELQEKVYGVIFGPFIPAYGVLLVGMGIATYIILRKGLRLQTGAKREKLKILSLSIYVTLPLVITLSFILPSITGIFAITEFGVTPVIILIAGFYYSVIKHQLFDVRLAVVRTVAYVLVLITLSAVYFMMAYLLSVLVFKDEVSSTLSASPVNIALALLLAFIFQPIKQFFDKTTNNIFYRDRYHANEFIARLSEELATTTDLRNLLERAAIEIATTLKTEQAFFFIQYDDTHHITAGTNSHKTLSSRDAEILETLEEKKDIIITDLLPENHSAHNVLSDAKVALLLPLLHKNKPIGYLALGEQLSTSFTKRDLSVLNAISDGLVIAIQNALSVQAVKNINAHLQQRIDEATKELRHSNSKLKKLDASKDEFISMASHQLRTPLTAVKGYVSMVLEGDVGRISKEQRQVLEQAYDSSQRMVFLIGDFLNVSRLQTGKFVLEPSMIDFTKLVEEEVDQLNDTARTRQITLAYEKPESVHMSVGDENKLRQVMMNFMDNAIFYSPTGSTVTIQLYREPAYIVFKVSDQGIGVPKDAQPKLFTKFFRASNARQQRPDGTGIGLYMAKKVIISHGGTVLFETKEGEGSTFGFKLPLKDQLDQLNKKPDTSTSNS